MAQVVFTIVCGPSAWQKSHDLVTNSRISKGKWHLDFFFLIFKFNTNLSANIWWLKILSYYFIRKQYNCKRWQVWIILLIATNIPRSNLGKIHLLTCLFVDGAQPNKSCILKSGFMLLMRNDTWINRKLLVTKLCNKCPDCGSLFACLLWKKQSSSKLNAFQFYFIRNSWISKIRLYSLSLFKSQAWLQYIYIK